MDLSLFNWSERQVREAVRVRTLPLSPRVDSFFFFREFFLWERVGEWIYFLFWNRKVYYFCKYLEATFLICFGYWRACCSWGMKATISSLIWKAVKLLGPEFVAGRRLDPWKWIKVRDLNRSPTSAERRGNKHQHADRGNLRCSQQTQGRDFGPRHLSQILKTHKYEFIA